MRCDMDEILAILYAARFATFIVLILVFASLFARILYGFCKILLYY